MPNKLIHQLRLCQENKANKSKEIPNIFQAEIAIIIDIDVYGWIIQSPEP